jgi:hypothetical protein
MEVLANVPATGTIQPIFDGFIFGLSPRLFVEPGRDP